MISLTCRREGRMGNQIIVYLVCFLISQKFKLKINIANYLYKEDINNLGIIFEKYCEIETNNIEGDNNQRGKCINDPDVYPLLNDKTELNENIWIHWWAYCQQPDVIKCIIDYFYDKNNSLPKDIISNNKYKDRYNNNNDVFIHMRLGDCFKHGNVPRWPILNYYKKSIMLIKKDNSIDNIFITTDNKNHELYSQLFNWCNDNEFNVVKYEENHVDTILFGSTCKNVILSAGSYGFIIGIFSFYSNIYVYEYAGRNWHPEYFCAFNHLPNVKMLTDEDF